MALSERHLLVDIDMLFDVRYAELSHFAPEAGFIRPLRWMIRLGGGLIRIGSFRCLKTLLLRF